MMNQIHLLEQHLLPLVQNSSYLAAFHPASVVPVVAGVIEMPACVAVVAEP